MSGAKTVARGKNNVGREDREGKRRIRRVGKARVGASFDDNPSEK